MPLIQIFIGINLNRIILILSSIPLLLHRPKIGNYFLLLIITISLFILFGLGTGRGFQYSSFSAPLIFGVIFFLYFDKRFNISAQTYQKFISSIYKVLIIGFIVEMIFNLIYPEFLIQTLNSELVSDYAKVKGKIISIVDIPFFVSLNSLYLGNQIASMISLSAIMWFCPLYGNNYIYRNNQIWFFLSCFFFLYTFTFTSILMFFLWVFLTVILIPSSRKNMLLFSLYSFPLIFLGLYTFFSSNVQMTYGIPIQHYFLGFMFIVFNFIDNLTLQSKLFGIPVGTSIGDYTFSHEFGYFIILMKLGVMFVSIILFLNIRALILAKKFLIDNYVSFMAKLNLIVFTVWHFSLIHYHPALKTGPVQLFGLHIALFFLFSQYYLNIQSDHKSGIRYLET